MSDVASVLAVLLLGTPMSVFIMGLVWYMHRIWRNYLPVEDIECAYKLKRLKQEIKKRGIDFDEMMQEYHELVTIKFKRKGILNRVDEQVEGELDEEPAKKSKAK
jgi:hypothetical protein